MRSTTTSPMRNGAAQAPRFTLQDDEEDEHLMQGPSSHRPQNVFNVDIEDNGDDMLMAWEQYSKPQVLRCCGREITITPPDWWYRFTKRQRRCMLGMGGCLLAITLLLILVAGAAAAKRQLARSAHGVGDACAWSEWRLPASVAPSRYNVTFDVQMADPWEVQGWVDIGINIFHETRCVVLHVADMQVVEARRVNAHGEPAVRRYDENLQQLTLEFNNPIPVGSTALYLSFRYKLSEGMSGFYRSTYMDADGQPAALAATQFEANSARAAFPCFDEPHLKAVFAVEVITSKGMTVLSNMPAAVAHHHDHQDADIMTWHFQPSPPMSTYLVAVVIGHLVSVNRTVPPVISTISGGGGADAPAAGTGTGEPRIVSVWGTPDQVANLEYAADAAALILPAYEAAFGVPYSLPKLDLVAIPDFSAGAMENWGLITYRQTALLVSPTSSLLDKRYVTKVVAHEMAHQWFGNAVTMKWWSDLWLNEGLASYLEYLGADAAHADLSFFEHFYVEDVPYALYFDSKHASHPMSLSAAKVNSTDVIEGLFDPVEYEKGGSLLRMLRAWLVRSNSTAGAPMVDSWESSAAVSGAATPATDTFLSGMQRYLQKNLFNATVPGDLWGALSLSSGVELEPLMEAWTYNQGYPLLTVTVDAKRSVWVQQAPFSLSGPAPCDSTAAWWVPVAYLSSEAPGQPKWSELNACQSLRPLIPLLPKGGWVKVNARQYGYYRVNYSPELWTALAAAAAQRDDNGFPVMKGVDFAGLLEDSYALAEAGVIDMAPFLSLIKALPLRPVTDYGPWAAALPYLYVIDKLVTPCSDAWKQYASRELVGMFMKNATAPAGGPGGTPVPVTFSFTQAAAPLDADVPIGLRLLRPEILRAAGFFGDEALVQEASKLLEDLSASAQAGKPSKEAVPADMRAAVYQTAARAYTSDPAVPYEQLKALYHAAKDADERERALRALGYSPSAVPDALELAVGPEVRPQDVRTLIIMSATHGGSIAARGAWDWLTSNWDRVHTKLGGDDEASRRMGQILEGVASASAEMSMLEEIDAVYAAHQAKQSDPGYASRAKEAVQANAKWVATHTEAVCTWVAEQTKAGGR